jgi:hypothetical protein
MRTNRELKPSAIPFLMSNSGLMQAPLQYAHDEFDSFVYPFKMPVEGKLCSHGVALPSKP